MKTTRPMFRKPVMIEVVKAWRRQVSSSSVEDPVVHGRPTNSKPLLFKQQPHPTLDRMIRVNQAGERAAVMIYAGQIAVLGKTVLGNCIEVIMNKTSVSHVALLAYPAQCLGLPSLVPRPLPVFQCYPLKNGQHAI